MQKILPVLLITVIVSSLLSYFTLSTFASHKQTRRIEVKSQRISRTTKVTPTNTPTPTPTPTEKPKFPTDVLLSDEQRYILDEINAYRAKHGLSEVKTDKYTCDFAKVRAAEISTSFNHDGFRNRINNKSLPYPNYKLVTENLASTSDYKKVVTLWVNSSGHAENMRKDTPYVCVEKNGKYYAYEGWKPL